ncbi:MAG: serine protease [Patulibacter minatonensis]
MFQALISGFARTAALFTLSLAALPSAAVADPGPAPVARAAATTIEGGGFTAGAGARIATPRIMGGGPISIEQAPWQVWVKIGVGSPYPDEYASCGGAILSPTKVLTAAHCAAGAVQGQPVLNGYGIDVIAGTSNIDAAPPTRQTRNVTSIRWNHAYDTREGHVATSSDLAVLEFANPLPFSAAIQAIRLPDPWTPTTVGTPVPTDLRVTGFGTEANGVGAPISKQLKAVTTTAVTDPDLCASGFENAVALCTHSGLGSSCHGDSGGPITTVGPNPVLVGIVSNGGLCGANYDDFYVNLLAPENRQFIDGQPVTLAPRYAEKPTMSVPKVLQVGQSIGCTATGYTNTPTAVRIDFTKDDGTSIGSVDGTSGSIVIPPTAAGQHISCRSYGANAGGTSTGTRLTTIATVAPAPVVATPAPATVVTPGAECPFIGARGDLAKWLDTSVHKTTISSRRNRYATAKIDVEGLPTTPYVIRIETQQMGGARASYKKTWDMDAGYDAITWKVPLKVPKSAKVGRTYRYDVLIRQTNTRAELKDERACGLATLSLKVRVKR